jgi:hypothetical protein
MKAFLATVPPNPLGATTVAAVANNSNIANNAITVTATNHHNNSGSNSRSNGGNNSGSVGSSSGGNHYPWLRGSLLVRAVCALFEHFAQEMDPVALVMLNTSEFVELRRSVAELLLLESDASKYYKSIAQPYLFHLAHQLDQLIPSAMSAAGEPPSRFSAEEAQKWETFFRSTFTDLHCVLTQQVRKFQKGMCKIPSDGAMIPDLLRRKCLVSYMTVLGCQLEDDGFELVDDYKALKVLSDVENEGLESSEDEDEYDDYDD